MLPMSNSHLFLILWLDLNKQQTNKQKTDPVLLTGGIETPQMEWGYVSRKICCVFVHYDYGVYRNL